jgi:hypothetical protein
MQYRNIAFVVGLAALSLIHSSSAQTADENKRFTGKWQAKVKDSVICTIDLRSGTGTVGSMEACRIHADAEGNLLEPESSDSSSKPSPISNVQIAGRVLSFEYRDEGEAEPTRFEMTLIQDDLADLVVMNAPVKIKPIRFARISSAQ